MQVLLPQQNPLTSHFIPSVVKLAHSFHNHTSRNVLPIMSPFPYLLCFLNHSSLTSVRITVLKWLLLNFLRTRIAISLSHFHWKSRLHGDSPGRTGAVVSLSNDLPVTTTSNILSLSYFSAAFHWPLLVFNKSLLTLSPFILIYLNIR